jgi:hypothetical protein
MPAHRSTPRGVRTAIAWLALTATGLLFLPGARPFSPPDDIPQERLVSSGLPPALVATALDSLFGADERVPRFLYTLSAEDPALPRGLYRIEVRMNAP